MEKIMRGTFSERWERLRPYVGFSLLVLIVAGGGVWAFSESRQPQNPVEVVKSGETHLPEATLAGRQTTDPEDGAEASKIAVDVAGAVVSPGVYELPEDARVTDALERAGGLSPESDQEWVSKNLNLAAKLSDGDKIYIPTAEETAKQTSSAAPITPPIPNSTGLVSGASTSSAQNCSRVNINTASAATLDECLPGIGPAYAQRIVDYRQSHGGFKSPEEIQNVSGIGPKTFEKIKGQITVD